MEITRQLSEAVFDARARTLALVADLSDDQLFGPRLPTVNPLHWEIGHIGWFQESWILRHALGRPPIREDGDRLYDSSAIPHDVRWDLPLPSRGRTIEYLLHTRDLVQKQLSRADFPESARYFVHLTIAHEDMHDEAIILTRQTLGYPPPAELASLQVVAEGEGDLAPGDAEIPAGSFLLGSAVGEEVFIHDNEKWAHSVDLDAFAIARAPVTQAEFAHFVDSGGYQEPAYWSEPGWQWRSLASAEHPVYWRRSATGWQRRHFDEWKPLEPRWPMVHVNWFEAEAYCRFAGRRLPSEAEWEVAASASPADGGGLAARKRRYPWGSEYPRPQRAHLDVTRQGCIDVAALPRSDSAFGCRQMIGNVWEWTHTPFMPYPGFSADPYRDYSQPWFGSHKVLRGGCWATRSRLIRNTWRNFYTPERRDIIAGFRTCRL